MNEIKVMIVADNPLARMGLAGMLANRTECTVVAQAAPDTALLDLIDVTKPEVLIWDSGWETHTEHLTEAINGGTPVIALLNDSADAHDIWIAGAVGLLPQNVSVDQLSAAIMAASTGLTVLDPTFSGTLLPRERPADPPDAIQDLTPREHEVLQLIAQGLPNKVIAQRLAISEHTVKFHVNAVMTKLGAQSRTDAVVRATRQGLIIL